MNMKLVCPITINGVEVVKTLTTTSGLDHASWVRQKPGVGKPFLLFNTLPGIVATADLDGAPIVSDDVAVNAAAIADMLANPPLDRLTFV